jgi:tetratricopeptide (TPR) repeat protein
MKSSRRKEFPFLDTKGGFVRRGICILLISAALLLPQAAAGQHAIEVQRTAARGEYLKALTLYDQMPQRRATKDARIAAAKSAWALSLPGRAIEEFDRVLRQEQMSDEDRARLLLSRGIIDYQEGRFQVAILFAEKAVSALRAASSLRAKAWLLWGESLMSLESFGAAEDKYLKALSECGAGEQADIHFLLGACEMKLGRLDQASAHLEEVPMDHERAPAAIRHLVEIALERKQDKEAQFWLTRGREMFPERFLDSWVDYALVQAAIRTGNAQQVESVRADANRKFPPSDPWLTLLNAASESFYWQSKQMVVKDEKS